MFRQNWMQQSIDAITDHAEEGIGRGTPSHLCWRTKNYGEFAELGMAMRHHGQRIEVIHKNKPLLWVKLHAPLTAHAICYMEVTAPRLEDNATHPAMLVFYQPDLEQPERVILPDGFVLRFQNKHASGLMPT